MIGCQGALSETKICIVASNSGSSSSEPRGNPIISLSSKRVKMGDPQFEQKQRASSGFGLNSLRRFSPLRIWKSVRLTDALVLNAAP